MISNTISTSISFDHNNYVRGAKEATDIWNGLPEQVISNSQNILVPCNFATGGTEVKDFCSDDDGTKMIRIQIYFIIANIFFLIKGIFSNKDLYEIIIIELRSITVFIISINILIVVWMYKIPLLV
jgi:hypothetical protein